jgi:DNA polymerase I-like protein with 3'-5' exonuclease and polymerase domains
MAGEYYEAITSADKLDLFVQRVIDSGEEFAFDIESDHHWPSPKTPQPKGALLTEYPGWFIVGFSFTHTLDGAFYVPINHQPGGNIDNPVQAAKAYYRLLETGRGIAHNAQFDVKGSARWFRDTLSNDPEYGPKIAENYGILYPKSDTQIEVFVDAETKPAGPMRGPGLALKALVKHYFDHDQKEFSSLFPEVNGKKVPANKQRFSMLEVSPQVVSYASEDAKWTLALHKLFMPKIKADPDVTRIYQMEMALVPTLLDMEIEGLALDWGRIAIKHREVEKFEQRWAEQIMEDLSERLGEVININLSSPPQVSDILFDRLHLPIKMRSKKTGNASTGVKALQAIAKEDPIVKSILQFREIKKLRTSYLKKYETELSYASNGRAYANHKATGAATGRLSVDGVSYQQWPKPYHYVLRDGTRFDLNFKDLLVAPENHRIVGYDFSQVELRIAAGMSGEKNLLDAFNSGIDIHKATASTMLKMPLVEITKKERSIGKTLNFATFYGTGPANVAEMLTSPERPVTTEDAQAMLDAYFVGFPQLRTWMDGKLAEGKRTGMVRTHFGRKYRIWDYEMPEKWQRSKGDRMCINAPVQGGAADYMKLGMVRVRHAIKKAEAEGRIPKNSIRLVMTIHDALEFYVHDDVSTQTVIDIVQPAVSFPVPGFPDIEILAEWHEGIRWGSVIEIKMDAQKQITHYEIEDVDQEFPTLEYAYNYLASKNLKVEKGPAPQAGLAAGEDAPEDEAEEEFDENAPSPSWGDKVLVPDYERTSLAIDRPEAEAHHDVPDDADEPPWARRPSVDVQPEPVDQGTAEPAPRARVAVVTLSAMPTQDSWQAFKRWLAQHMGEQTVRVVTPEGPVELDGFAVVEEDQPVLSLMLHGASLHFEASEEDFTLEGIL